jgi:protein TonB
VLSFTITADGGVTGARVSRSSGDAKLDQAGLNILAKASPFPPIPAEAGRKSWKMTVPVDFR